MRADDVLIRDLTELLTRRGVKDAAVISTRLVGRVYRELAVQVKDDLATAHGIADASQAQARQQGYDIAAYRSALNQIMRGEEDPQEIARRALTMNTRLPSD